MLASLGFFGIVIAVMCGIIGLGFVAALIMSRVRYHRYMKVFREDVSKGRFEKLPS